MARSTEDMQKKRRRIGSRDDGEAAQTAEILRKSKVALHEIDRDGESPTSSAGGNGNPAGQPAKKLQGHGKRLADLPIQRLDEQEKNESELPYNSSKRTDAAEVEDLTGYIQNLGGKLESGWQVTSHRRHSQGKLTKTYISPSNERFRSRVEVAKHLGLSPDPSHKEQSASREPKMKNSGKAKENGSPRSFSPNYGPSLASDARNKIKNVSEAHTEVPSVPIVTQRCQEVLRSIISTESFAALSNMLSGGSASRSMEPTSQFKALPVVAGALDFKLIHVRLSTGAYGSTPELFATDIQQVWKNIISAANELIALANMLSEHSGNLYKKEILSLFQGASREDASTRSLIDLKEMPEGGKEPSATAIQTSKLHANLQGSSVHAKKALRKSKKRAKKSGKSKKPGALDDGVANGSVSRICKLCGIEQQGGDSIICSKCTLEFHTQCVELPSNGLLPGEWYCPLCVREKVLVKESEKDGGEMNSDETSESSGQKKALVSLGMAEETMNHNVSDRGLASKDSLVLSSPDCSIEHDETEQVEVPEASVEDGPPLPSTFLQANENVCKICRSASRKSLFSCPSCLRCYHLSCFRPRLKKRPQFCPFCICKVCSIHADDDKVLLCEACDQGYHTYCLEPALPKIPKGDWYCPVCVEARNVEPSSPQQMEVLKRKRKSTEPRRSI